MFATVIVTQAQLLQLLPSAYDNSQCAVLDRSKKPESSSRVKKLWKRGADPIKEERDLRGQVVRNMVACRLEMTMLGPFTLPLLRLSDARWEEVQLKWICSFDLDQPARLTNQFQLVQPWVAESCRKMFVSLGLLVDQSSADIAAISKLAKKRCLPTNQELFQARVDSLVLKSINDERQKKSCDYGDAMAPWHGFRNLINNLRREKRHFLLKHLPWPGLESDFNCPNEVPNNDWVDLWDELAEGVPLGCFPSQWITVRESCGPRAKLRSPWSSFYFGKPVADGQDAAAVSLANQVFRAGVLMESNLLDGRRLYLNEGVIPDSIRGFSKIVHQLVRRLGGFPQSGSFLGQLLREICSWNRESNAIDWSIFDPIEVLSCAEELGCPSFKIRMIEGGSFSRRGEIDKSFGVIEDGLRCATSRKEVAVALTNLSVTAYFSGQFDQSLSLVNEALQYNPTSSFAKFNKFAIRHNIGC